MANVIIPAADMLKKKQVEDPRTKFQMMGSNKWRYDSGLERYLQDRLGRSLTYNLFVQKRNKTLQDLFLYASESTAVLIAKYYEFQYPEHFRSFVLWVYNGVAPSEKWWFPKLEQMDYFPYEALHKMYVEKVIEGKEVANG